MTKPEEKFGTDAGKVWAVLKENKKELTVIQISKKTNISPTRVYAALGWLGREGKLRIVHSRKGYRYALAE